MTPAYGLSCNDRVLNWLTRVDTQYDEATPEKVKAADYDRATQSLGLGKITNNYFFSSARPASASRSWFSGDTTTTTNSNNRTYVDNRVHVHTAPVGLFSDSEDEGAKDPTKKKKTKEEKTNWKGIAAIGAVSTAVAGVSIFVYARLSKAAEGAINYLENTKRIESWASTSLTLNSDPRINQIAQIAEVQTKIDQRAVDKITNYTYSMLTSLVGTLTMAGGGVTILAAAPALATAGTTAVVAGGVLNSIAVMYAAYNCGMHWSDKEEGKKEFTAVKRLIPDLVTAFTPNAQPQTHNYSTSHWQNPQWTEEQPPAYSDRADNMGFFRTGSPPPSYDESQAAIRNQRENPRNIYPDLSGFIPSAPTYESTTKTQY
ncbi:MAG: hypothetical protein WBD50_04500 [Candidatus Rhabdochlamydia sp.]